MESPSPQTCRLDGCDKPAPGTGKITAFCTQRHYHTDWRIRTGRLVVKELKYCAYPACGAAFTPRLDTQMYCRQEHRKAHHASRGEDGRTVGHAKRSDATRARNQERSQAWVAANPSRARELQRNRALRDRGLTATGFDELAAQFGGACWICRRLSTELTRGGRVRSLHIDHDHAFPAGDPAGVRGLLDTGCNTRLAVAEDTALVAGLRAYLRERADYQPPAAGPADTRRGTRWQAFGLTEQQYQAMRDACGHRCEVCRRPEPTLRSGKVQPLFVDHDHAKSKGERGFIRGLLCNGCNTALGIVENAEWWDLAVAYLAWAPPLTQRLLGDVAAAA